MKRLTLLFVCLAGCAAVDPADTADAGPDGGMIVVADGGDCDRSTDPATLPKDGPSGLEACRIHCTCVEGEAIAQVSIGDFCAGPEDACAYTCDFVERGLWMAGEYCYLGSPMTEQTGDAGAI